MALTRYPLNPDYGTGAFRRRIRLRKGEGFSSAILDDNHHAMWVRLHHGGGLVTAVESEMVRIPADTCPGARAILTELVGTPIDVAPEDLFVGGRARRHCTHLFDLAVMALTFTQREGETQVIDIVLPDAEGERRVQALVDGRLVHDWRLREEMIVAPAWLAGQDLIGGFVRRIFRDFTGVERDAALMIQKGVGVARGRPHVIDGTPGRALKDAVDMLGACYTYSEPRFSIAREIGGHARDFSEAVIEIPGPA